MPLDVLGHTRATLKESSCAFPFRQEWVTRLNLFRAGDWRLQLSAMNEEFLVSVSHHLALIRSLALVHTAPSLLPIEYFSEDFGLAVDLAFGSSRRAEKMPELDYLEEIKVVTSTRR
ncbi:hypothetical protein JTE90_011510 [Oedothorax gibbosus]|uniref:Uncharacterized protein n=1 Tax=Oedothorax gibbosus TaxID=931172 RepID=A0AAV6TGX7_9ARAC|nr:hypothetical protein JTE90_011510 [Oedothorax gibbosus]